jgi:hypothetical protein
MSTRAEMVCNGLIRIAEMREIDHPIRLVCDRIPRRVLELTYSIQIPTPASHEDQSRVPTPSEFLDALGYMRGFMTRHGVPDQSRCARVVLTDYMNGDLLYCHAPPDLEQKVFAPFDSMSAQRNVKVLKALREEEETRQNDIDDDDDDDSEGEENEEGTGGGEDNERFSLDVGEESPQSRGMLPNAYSQPRRGRKATRRHKEKLLTQNQSGSFTTGKVANSNYNGRYQMGGYSGLPTDVKFTKDSVVIQGEVLKR